MIFQTQEIVIPKRVNFANFIESSGTQYIDTGFKPNQNTRVVIDLYIEESSAYQSIFGCRTTTTNNTFSLFATPNNAGFRNDYANGRVTAEVSSAGRHLIDVNKNVLTVDGAEVGTNTASTFQTAYNMYLLQNNTAGAIASAYPFSGKLYSCRIYDNGTLIRDFVPCLDSEGVACLYDKVTKEYYYNAGTGDFTAG